MMAQLPALGFNPQNALLDTSPVVNALQNLTRNRLAQQESDRQDQELAMRKQAHGQNMRTGGLDYEAKLARHYGGIAQMIDQEQDPAKRQAMWGRMVQSHPEFGRALQEHGVNPADHMQGPKFLIAQARGYQDPAVEQERKLDMDLKRAQIGSLNRKAEPDPIDTFILSRLRGAAGAAPSVQPPQAPPAIQPQSFNGQGPMPGVQLIADQQTGTASQAAPQGDMVETIYGRMPRDEAQSLAGSMLLSPKYSAAGRAILDSIAKGSDVGMSKPAQNQLDERTISAASTLGRLQEIKKQFRPEFLQIPERLKMMGASWGAKFGGKLAPEDQKQLQDFARFKATAFDNFNQLLKEMSGTAVNAQELSRQQIVQPNPGEGLFDGDDPVTFMSKIEQGERIAKAAVARMNFMRTQGLRFNKETAEQFMRLEDVQGAIRQRGSQIEQELRQTNPQADPMTIQQETKRRLKQEFGI